MYFPILRGRQFELLALQECLKCSVLSPKIIPIVEPVKVSATFRNTIQEFIQRERPIAIIRNPQVGSWLKDKEKEKNEAITNAVTLQLKNKNVIPSLYVTHHLQNDLIGLSQSEKIDVSQLILLCNKPDSIRFYEESVGNAKPLYNLVPDRSDFRRRIRPNRVLCENHFPKKERNVDYPDQVPEFYSSDHLYYEEDGYTGFSDYSIVGNEYSDSGFAPYAVAIHIVYFDDAKALRIMHFVSDSNDDISDPARKFSEALEKLVEWNKKMQLDTVGMRAFEKTYATQSYPGLGVVKKLSIMHHLEIISRFLDGELK